MITTGYLARAKRTLCVDGRGGYVDATPKRKAICSITQRTNDAWGVRGTTQGSFRLSLNIETLSALILWWLWLRVLHV